jgi:hypothetical protein
VVLLIIANSVTENIKITGEKIMAKRASDSGHYYDRLGNPAYTVIGKNGKERNTTLRDARELDLVPSVTTILRVASAPGLERWKQEQILLAALTLPKMANETEGEYLSRVLDDSRAQGKAAADEGTAIHGAIQSYFEGKEYPDHHEAYVKGCVTALREHFGEANWICEKSFATENYGGKVDLQAKGIVVDIKTKEFGPDDEVAGYEEHCMQLAAYRNGLGMDSARCANVFVSRNNPGLAVVYEWDQKELERGGQMFKSLLTFWYLKTQLGA